MIIPRVKCKKCGHEWIPRTEIVRKCPKCNTLFRGINKDNIEVVRSEPVASKE